MRNCTHTYVSVSPSHSLIISRLPSIEKCAQTRILFSYLLSVRCKLLYAHACTVRTKATIAVVKDSELHVWKAMRYVWRVVKGARQHTIWATEWKNAKNCSRGVQRHRKRKRYKKKYWTEKFLRRKEGTRWGAYLLVQGQLDLKTPWWWLDGHSMFSRK
jgi:hypothetical protein